MTTDDDLWNQHRRAFGISTEHLYPKDCFFAGLAVGRAEVARAHAADSVLAAQARIVDMLPALRS